MLSADKLSQHAFGLSEARETRHVIPACSSLDKLSQHAVSQLKAREARHTIPACSGSQSWHKTARHTVPTYTVQAGYPSIHCAKLTCIKETAKAQNSGQADTAMHCTTRRTRTRGAAELAAKTPWKTGQDSWGIGLHQLSCKLEDQ